MFHFLFLQIDVWAELWFQEFFFNLFSHLEIFLGFHLYLYEEKPRMISGKNSNSTTGNGYKETVFLSTANISFLMLLKMNTLQRSNLVCFFVLDENSKILQGYIFLLLGDRMYLKNVIK